MEDEDLFGQGTGEARDSVSTLPKKIAVQVLLQCYNIYFFHVLVGRTWGEKSCISEVPVENDSSRGVFRCGIEDFH